jgi:hypothetical protein
MEKILILTIVFFSIAALIAKLVMMFRGEEQGCSCAGECGNETCKNKGKK